MISGTTVMQGEGEYVSLAVG